jgi:hypothetical protein
VSVGQSEASMISDTQSELTGSDDDGPRARSENLPLIVRRRSDPRTPLETSLRLTAVGARQKVLVALGAHFIWVRSPRHGERSRA